jgi:hypothetical protein
MDNVQQHVFVFFRVWWQSGRDLKLRNSYTVGNYVAQYVDNHINYWAIFTHINPLKTGFLLNNIWEFSSYLTGNVLRRRYKAQPVNAV